MIYLKINTVGSLLPVRIICILSFCYLCQSEQNKPVLFTEVYFKIRFKVLKHVCGNNCPPETTIAHITRSLIGKKKKIANYVTEKNSENTICTCWHWAALILPDPDTYVGCSQKIVHSIKKKLVPGCCFFLACCQFLSWFLWLESCSSKSIRTTDPGRFSFSATA